MIKAFAKLPEGATSIDVLQALPPAAKECLDFDMSDKPIAGDDDDAR